MRHSVLLLGLAAVAAAVVVACGRAGLPHAVLRAHAALAGELFTIPLAAEVKR